MRLISVAMSNIGIQLGSYCVSQVLRHTGNTEYWDSCSAGHNSARQMIQEVLSPFLTFRLCILSFSCKTIATSSKGLVTFHTNQFILPNFFIAALLLTVHLKAFFSLSRAPPEPSTSLERATSHFFLEIALWLRFLGTVWTEEWPLPRVSP